MAGFRDIQLTYEVSQRLLRGERHALGEVYRELAGAVMGLAMRILQDRGLAEEVVQDTFVELMEKAEQIRDAHAVVGWVRKVATNHCLMRLRSPWHVRRSASEPYDEPFDHGTDGVRGEGLQVIEQALANLAPEARAVVWLHDVEGYTHKEIGELMGKTSSYSKSQLARAYEKLLLRQEPATPAVGRGITVGDNRDGDGQTELDGIGSPSAS